MKFDPNTRSKRLVKSVSEIKMMEEAGRMVAETLSYLKNYVKPGVKTIELDKIAEDFILTKNGIPAFKGYEVKNKFFPGSLCISVNDEIVHGIPSNRILQEGDIVSLDCGVELNGYFGDSAVTYPVGVVSKELENLMSVTEKSLYLGIQSSLNKGKIYHISQSIQEFVEKNGYSLTRELVGHGIGKKLHEEPPVPNFVPPLLHRDKYPNYKLLNGMTLAIEPMVHFGKKETTVGRDGWTVLTADGKSAAHFEHTIVINDDKPIILTMRD